ncbi:MAG: bifunctional methylenetetrahydrofolate dehydrogenase/methenyltetrahydrofolate cyclohydrolase FolD [Candidatus Aenigmarchaeota archaeon]|nr:bifunctional methylenetetrahydrofolate dehydrogenase/methenyltetrahydrofolate cyclohydrolase FolD [Candidatus Aenigmarchaeota archaeon]
MTAKIIDGREIAGKIKEELEKRVGVLKEKGVTPKLVVILVGNDPASDVYVRSKMKRSKEIGIASELIRYPEDITENELLEKIAGLNKNPEVHGILVQLPLPNEIDEKKVIDSIDPKKDVDGFSPVNVGNLLIGETAFESCTPKGIMRMLDIEGIPVEGKEIVIINRSNIVGKPLTAMMIKKSGTVTVCHSRTKDIPSHTRRADILVSAVGKPKFITEHMVKEEAVVIDVGTTKDSKGKLCGDVDFEKVKEKAGYITPVPGGVGPMTVIMLMENTVTAAENQ